MSQENVEAVQRVYEGVSARMVIPPELFDPDLELVDVDAVGVSRGPEAAQESLREYWETFEDFHVEMEAVIHVDEELVITAVRDGGHIRGSDSELWNRFFHVWSFRHGKIVRLSIHTDKDRALETAGLRD